MKKIVIALCYSNLWVAIQIALFCLPFSYSFLPKTFAWKYSAMVFFFSFLVYTLLRREALKNKPETNQQPQLIWIYQYRNFIVTLFFLAVLSVFIFFFWFFPLKFTVLWILVLPLIWFYNRSFEHNVPAKKSLRKIGFLKPLVITFCVIFVAYYVPVFDGLLFFDREFSRLAVLLEGLALFVFVLALVLPFDIRDLQYDRHFGLQTIPVVLGERKTRLFCILLMIFYALIYLIIYLLELNTMGNIWPHLITALAGIGLLLDRDLTKESWEYLFWVDGILGLPAFLWLAFK